jgi:hypothetical protein
VSALRQLLEGAGRLEAVEAVMAVFADIAVPRQQPYELRIRVGEDHAFVEFTATRDERPEVYENYGPRLAELVQLAERWGHSHLRTADVWWARIGDEQ